MLESVAGLILHINNLIESVFYKTPKIVTLSQFLELLLNVVELAGNISNCDSNSNF